MKTLLTFILLINVTTAINAQEVPHDRLHDYCTKMSNVVKSVIAVHDQGMPVYSINRGNINAEGIAGSDLKAIISAIYDEDTQDLTSAQLTAGAYKWCLSEHQVDMGEWRPGPPKTYTRPQSQ